MWTGPLWSSMVRLYSSGYVAQAASTNKSASDCKLLQGLIRAYCYLMCDMTYMVPAVILIWKVGACVLNKHQEWRQICGDLDIDYIAQNGKK